MLTLNTSPLRTLTGMAFGLAIPLATMAERGPSIQPLAPQASAAVGQALAAPFKDFAGRRNVAEVEVGFDRSGHVARARIQRSSGSPRSDAAALKAAVELAGLRRPADVAGRIVVFRVNVGAGSIG